MRNDISITEKRKLKDDEDSQNLSDEDQDKIDKILEFEKSSHKTSQSIRILSKQKLHDHESDNIESPSHSLEKSSVSGNALRINSATPMHELDNL